MKRLDCSGSSAFAGGFGSGFGLSAMGRSLLFQRQP